ncbi:MAG TPA: excinuclease ABC subunit UvrB, partial [Euryarchaeota archaeon]|nr:excinuclease ABC subunit UvrB [Euryarchaeota archaeon]
MTFKLESPFKPSGHQPQAISKLVSGIENRERFQTLLGVTGSGKTFTVANVVEKIQRPTLVISHNKTLAGQLYREFKEFFPHNAVEYFVSYYDYYLPESYIPTTDTYIAKEVEINRVIDRYRHHTTASLLTRKDVLVVASVSCIFGLGSPDLYREMFLIVNTGDNISREQLIHMLVERDYKRNDTVPESGQFRAKGRVLDIVPPMEDIWYRVVLDNNVVDSIMVVDPLKRKTIEKRHNMSLPPAKHTTVSKEYLEDIVKGIGAELDFRLEELRGRKKILEAARLEQRVVQDMETILETGQCPGVENYSMYFSRRNRGDRPYTLLDFFSKYYLLVIDESHVTLPQIRGMYKGDRSRKQTLVDFGFRLPSALENRPLQIDEFLERIPQTLLVSATPGDWELERSSVAEQLVRPTGLLDPQITILPSSNQIDDLLERIRQKLTFKDKVLVTTLTKRMAEDLTSFLNASGVRARYLHSDIHTLERMKLINDMVLDEFDVMVGINLLREGLDLPEVSLVAILDGDK